MNCFSRGSGLRVVYPIGGWLRAGRGMHELTSLAGGSPDMVCWAGVTDG